MEILVFLECVWPWVFSVHLSVVFFSCRACLLVLNLIWKSQNSTSFIKGRRVYYYSLSK